MVGCLIVGGYVLSWDQAAEWTQRRGIIAKGNFPAYGQLIKSTLIKEGLLGKLMNVYVTDWPKGYVQRRGNEKKVKDGTGVVFLSRRHRYDVHATRFKYDQMEALTSDRNIYEFMLKEGFDLPWATIPDPLLALGLDALWMDGEDDDPRMMGTLPPSGVQAWCTC